MAFTRNPTFHFDALADLGVDTVPMGSVVFVNESQTFYEKIADASTPANDVLWAIDNNDLFPLTADLTSLDGGFAASAYLTAQAVNAGNAAGV